MTDGAAIPCVGKCRTCGAESVGLFHDPDATDCRRSVCGACQGKANRRILDNLNSSGRHR